MTLRLNSLKSVALWVAVLAMSVLLYTVFIAKPTAGEMELNFSKFLDAVHNGNVKTVTIVDTDITGQFVSGGAFKTVAPADYPALYDMLEGINVKIEHPTVSLWLSALISWAPFLLIIGFWIFFMRQMKHGGNSAQSFGKSRARRMTTNQKKVTFKDVAGVEEAR